MAIVKRHGSRKVHARRTVRGDRGARFWVEALESRRLLATIIVNSSGDADGADGSATLSLRQAIEVSNGTLAISALSPGQAGLVVGTLSTPNRIDFAIPGVGPFVISPASALPVITSPVVIDGYSQAGAHPNTNGPGQGKNTVIQIELDGANAAADANGLDIQAGQSTVQGLAIFGFSTGAGILLEIQTGDLIQGDFIGTDVTGNVPLPNSNGILDTHRYVSAPETFDRATTGFNTVGGTAAGAGNVISGNSSTGLALSGKLLVAFQHASATELIQGNFIGVNASGTASLPNGGGGIGDDGGTQSGMQNGVAESPTTIGGTAAGAGNLISGNAGDGLEIGGYNATVNGEGDQQLFASNDLVQGNLIGTNVTGLGPLPNAVNGIRVSGATPTIGGTLAGAGNVISGNGGNGLAIMDFNTKIPGGGVFAQGNHIGTDLTGTMTLPNGGNGISFASSGGDSTVGGPGQGAGNVISFNRGSGVLIANPAIVTNFPASLLISQNSIDGNGNLGIRYATPGSFLAAPAPVLGSVVPEGAGSMIAGRLDAMASQTYLIEFFSNTSPDPSGSGQGQAYLGSTTVTTDTGGHATFTFSSASPLLGRYVSATATETLSVGLSFHQSTSEFSDDLFGYTLPKTSITLLGTNRVATQGQPITFTALVASTTPGTLAGLVVFLEDGVPIGSAAPDANGLVTFVTDQLQPGPHVITANYLGDPTHPASSNPSNALAISVFNATAFGGPAVTSDVFSGTHAVTVTFNRGLFIGPAQDLANYKLVGPHHQKVAILAAVYNPANASVTLTTLEELDPHESYQLTINGQTGDRVVDVFGIALKGEAKGKPGHNYSGKVAVKKAPVAKVAHPQAPKPNAHATVHKKSH